MTYTDEQTGITWRKASASVETDCVEVAFHNAEILVRDSKDRTGTVLAFTRGEWDAFVAGARDGEFDLV